MSEYLRPIAWQCKQCGELSWSGHPEKHHYECKNLNPIIHQEVGSIASSAADAARRAEFGGY